MHTLSRRARRVLGIAAALVATAVIAGTTYADFLKSLAQRESSMDASAINRETRYVGLYQMGELSLQDAGIYSGDGTYGNNDYKGSFTGKDGVSSLDDFLADPEAQTQAITRYHNLVWNNYLTQGGSGGAANYVGQTINGITVTQSGLIAAAHLVGHGPVKAWLASGGATAPADKTGTKMTEYLQRFAGYQLSASAPSFTAVQASSPTGGSAATVTNPTYTSTAPPLVSGGGGAPSVLSGSAPYASAEQGFLASTGYSMSTVHLLIATMTATVVLLWLAVVMLKSWMGYTGGAVRLIDMGQTSLRAIVVTLIFILLLNA